MKKLFQLLLITALTAGSWACSNNDSNAPVSANSDKQVTPADNSAPEKAEYVPAPAARKPTTGSTRAEAPAKSSTPAAPAQPTQPPAATNPPADSLADADATEEAPRPAAVAPARAIMTVPAGTKVTVALIDPLSTETNEAGDAFIASLTEPIIVAGKVVAESGTRVQGRVQRVEEPGKVKGRAALELTLTGIRDGSQIVEFSTEPFTVAAEDNTDRDTGIIAGGAGVGAIIGAIAGGKKGAAIGAVIGGGSGTTAVLVTKGEHIRLDSETKLNFVLDDSVRLAVIRNAPQE